MFQDEVNAVGKAAESKIGLMKTKPLAYFFASMLAGMYVGFGILLIFTIGGYLSAAGSPAVKIVMGVSFGVALSLVVMAGAELFTGNNFVMAAGLFQKKVGFADTCALWGVCWLGNLAGSVLLAFMYHFTGLGTGDVGTFIANGAAGKMAVAPFPLFFRAVLCNILVCLAVWCGFKLKTEAGKLIMIFWCLFVFITAGFEHSIANMTLLTVGLLEPGQAALSMGGYIYNLLVVTLGNMVGGILFVAVPYYLLAADKK